MRRLTDLFSNTKNWILDSGLVICDTNSENLGGIHSFYDVSSKNYGFLYPEITGYFLSTIRFLHTIDSSVDVNLAKISANWLLKIYEKYGGIVQGISNNKPTQNLVYSFDTAICSKGLLDCYEITREDKYLIFAEKLLDWLKTYSLESDGTSKPYFNLENNQFEESFDVWYKQKGCLHIKSAIPFLQLYKITNEKQFLDIGTRICDSMKFYQNDDGSVKLHQNNNLIHMHSLCYAIEGLIYCYAVSKNNFYLKQCNAALDWCASKIESDGGSNLWFYSKNKPAKTSYHTAQIMRLMILLDKVNGNDHFKNSIAKLGVFLKSLQSNNDDNKINGGFHEEFFKSLFGWKIRQRVNSWSSMFALQALYWYDNYDKISFENEINYLF